MIHDGAALGRQAAGRGLPPKAPVSPVVNSPARSRRPSSKPRWPRRRIFSVIGS